MSQKMWEELYNETMKDYRRLVKKADRAAQEYESQKQVWIEKRAELQEEVDRYRNLAGELDIEFGDLKREKIELEKELEKLRSTGKDLNKYDRDSFENELEVRRAAADLRAHADYLDRVADSMRHTGI